MKLKLDNEEGAWLGDDLDDGRFWSDEGKIIKNILEDENWEDYNPNKPYVSKLNITKESLQLLLDYLKKQMEISPPKDMKRYRQYKQTGDPEDIIKIDEELDGAAYRLAESITIKVKKLIRRK